MATMNISLPDQMKEWVERRAATGRYSNSSDVLRDLIREAQDREAAAIAHLQREIDKGRQSARTPLTLDEVFTQARERAIAAAKARDDAA
jgi:antitoxin ParD1/3/4